MKIQAVVLFILFIAAAAFAGESNCPPAKAATTADSVKAGGTAGMTEAETAKLVQLGGALAQKDRCVICHKAGGMGQPLAGIAEGKTDEYLIQTIVAPKEALGADTRMPAYKYTEKEAMAMVEYLRSLPKQ